MSKGLELLATLCHACELVGLDAGPAAAQWSDTAAQGDPLCLVFELTRSPDPERHLCLTLDPKAETVEVAARLLKAHTRPEWVYGALQINHELPHGGPRFSMDMSNGDLVYSFAEPTGDLQSDALALSMAEALMALERLTRLGMAASRPSSTPGSVGSAEGFMVRG